ncbi:MAG: hypothetical protein QOF62_864 [Pyrinomonadaceae bacterium]|jgi:hypothetical protein|nr:hypothetical protein [Pyrinomonadaceae bacterium]
MNLEAGMKNLDFAGCLLDDALLGPRASRPPGYVRRPVE